MTLQNSSVGCGLNILMLAGKISTTTHLPASNIVADLDACRQTPLRWPTPRSTSFCCRVMEHIRNVLPMMQNYTASPHQTRMVVRIPVRILRRRL